MAKKSRKNGGAAGAAEAQKEFLLPREVWARTRLSETTISRLRARGLDGAPPEPPAWLKGVIIGSKSDEPEKG
jgi:hypothetical protein